MFIKLQPDQVMIFWNMIKHGMIVSYNIPKKYQQDFTLNSLEQILLGNAQCWIGYSLDEEGNKQIHYTLTTKIVDEKYYGVRCLFIDSIYGHRLITEDMVTEINDNLVPFAKANNCDAIVAEYTLERVKQFLMSQGFEYHSSTCRKILR